MDERDPDSVQFELNPKLDVEKLHEEFTRIGRLRIRQFLLPAAADSLYQHLVHNTAWRTFLVANEQLLGTAPGEPVGLGGEEEDNILGRAYEGARKAFAYVYDADRLFPEDESGSAQGASPEVDTPLVAFDQFLGSDRFMEFIRYVTGGAELSRIATQATRFRPGHFAGFHAATWSADKTRKRRASFLLNLTPEWKPEWGGSVGFRSTEADISEAFVPTFNTLDVLAFPQGRWVSAVAPFAGGARLAIEGRLYVP